MQRWGKIVVILGACGAVFALNMDTSVSTAFGRVQNIGLLNDRQNYLIISCVVIVAGVLMTLLGRFGVSSAHAEPSTGQGVPDHASSMRQCPHCAEQIKAEAKLCRFCNSEVIPTITRCTWCDQVVQAPHTPCADLPPSTLDEMRSSVKNVMCREQIDQRVEGGAAA